ncbi:hypothetical protein ALC62_05237 [Cyphomyrmex costatus]|uniref:PDZ domain-containing protein n=1 Tax=Cyphomyrmex costatus TaxID=456900 RepID=A0A151IJX0_9HYME|nr:hypothetical protein ALC62_05237 [Cyphomyrmex costatus]
MCRLFQSVPRSSFGVSIEPHRTASRDPDSNIVLGIGRSASLSEPAGFGAISHEIHAAEENTGGNTRYHEKSKIEHVKRCTCSYNNVQEQVHQVIVFSQRDRKWRVWEDAERIVKRTSERQSNNGTDVYIAICFSCPPVRCGNQVAIYLIVTATSLVPSLLPKSKQHRAEGQPEHDQDKPSCLAHGENLNCLRLKSQLDVNPGSKAAQQGVREGDFISNINERSTRDLTNSEAHALLRNSGEQLKLGLNQENIGSPKRRIYRSSLQENTTTEIQNSRDHHKDHNDDAHTDGVGEERCHGLFRSSDDWIITTPRVECACVLFTHTRNPPVPSSHVHSHVRECTPATTTTRCNSMRAHPWLSGKTLHRGGDPLLLLFFLHGATACGPTFLVQYRGTPCRARRAELSSFEVVYFKKKHPDFRLSVDGGSGIDRLIFRKKS